MPGNGSLERHIIDVVDGKFSSATGPADLDASLAAWRASEHADHLLIHFHGGLVSRKAATATAERLLQVYPQGGAWPLFMVWNSDLITTIGANLDEIAREPVFQRLLRKLAQLMAESDGGLLRTQPELMAMGPSGSISTLQCQIAHALVPTIDPGMRDSATKSSRFAELLRRSASSAGKATALTARFHVPHGTAVRAASALLDSLQARSSRK